MNGFLRLMLVIALSGGLVRCASLPPEEGGSEAADSSGATDQDFADFDNPEGESTTENSGNTEAAIEDELNQADGAPQETAQEAPVEEQPQAATEEAPNGGDEFAQFDDPAATPPVDAPVEDPAVAQTDPMLDTPPPEIEPAPPEDMSATVDPGGPAPDVVPAPIVEAPVETPPEVPEEQAAAPADPGQLVNIKNITYKANDSGGTVVVEADGPMTFQTRTNADTGQFIIEIPGAKLPRKLKRPFNTKDMKGGIGSIDSYQNAGSSTARIVVQLRQGAAEPVVQSEGNSLLIVEGGAAAPAEPVADAGDIPVEESGGTGAEASQIMSSQSLEEFMAGNTQFYGKKISLETSEMDVRDVFKLIGEESGVNLVLSDEVKGTVSVKLRQVPWDQALVVIMKAKKLGYTRAGNVLRIAPLADIKAEEDETVRLATAKRSQSPLKVRMIPVSYAKVDELANQVKQFVSDRGKVIGDTRTSSLVVSDIDENMERIVKLVTSIDVPPPQVLIEGKVVEASDQFQRQVGVNWAATGRPSDLGYASNGRKIRNTTSIGVSPGVGASALSLNFQMGTLDILGDLTATLGLFEKQNLVKVLSAPRIMTLHNEPAEINQTTEIPLIQENQTASGTTRSVTFKPVKLRLSVVPQITNDAAVIMAVDVNRDFLGGVENQETGARAVNSRAAKTKVMVKNGQTAVIGGIFQSDTQSGETKVPWVGDIPILGWLFKNRANDAIKNELLIFLTPRIVGQADSQGISSEVGGDL